ncbi:hypothetical protein RHSIM_RhsimUnG0000500 [Rhododendron simsii]|uniref:Uncharacterized protein n=1 Tax=Rhododendron simsii TaxID=118357 RepID=A0A834FY15_RHOSS|nr:hypothetical protein RHSIM_RhsimUnG0000500 [Rhododendron simsii]
MGILRNKGLHCETVNFGQKSHIHGKSFAQMVSGETNKRDSDGKEAEKGLLCSDQGCRRVFVQQRSENHRDSPISDEALGVVANDVNVESQSKDINSSSTHGLESIVEDSMGLTSLFQEADHSRGKSQGNEILSHFVPMVTVPTKPINEGEEAGNEPLVFDSGNNIRASQFAGINLMVDFRPKEIDQEQFKIAEELQETIRASTKIGIKYDDAGVLRMKKMIEQEAKDLESILRDNPFAPLQREKSHPKATNE